VDGFILSDETAVGVSPINAVNILNSLIAEAEVQKQGRGTLW
jgi:pyruvate kinase